MDDNQKEWIISTLKNLISNIESDCGSEFVLDTLDDIRGELEE